MRRRVSAWLLVLAAPAGRVLRVLGQALPGLIGLGLLSFGAWLAYAPAGPIVAGALLLADRVAVQRRARSGGGR